MPSHRRSSIDFETFSAARSSRPACFTLLEVKSSFIHQWFYSLLLPLASSSVTYLFYTDGRTPWASDQPVARPLPTYRATQTQIKRTQTSMPPVRFEPTIPAFERVPQTARPATVIGAKVKSYELKV
jgi:hypothetical protein